MQNIHGGAGGQVEDGSALDGHPAVGPQASARLHGGQAHGRPRR
jgi:hypothetical protein